MKEYILKTYPIFRNRDFRLYFYGQAISFTGNWLQNVAQGWLVLEITHSAYWVGLTYALPYIVGAAVAPLGGMIADRFNKKTVLYWMQFLEMFQAFLLGILAITHHVNVPIIISLAILLGIFSAIDGVVRNPFAIEIIEVEHIGAAMALNGALQTLAMVVGPGLGGFAIALFGSGWTFMINGLTFIPVIIFLVMIRHVHKREPSQELPFKMIISGFKYAAGHYQLLLCLLSGMMFFFAGFSFRAILPTMAADVFKAGPEVLGWLGSAAGLGACIGAMIISAKSKKRLPLNLFISGGALLNGVALIAASFTGNIYAISLFLLLAGLGFTLGQSTTRAESQVIIDSKMRGRVMGLTMLSLYLGLSSGNYLAGLMADRVSISFSLRVDGLIMLLLAIATFVLIPWVYAKPRADLVEMPILE